MITIIDYNAGNTASVSNALEGLGEKYIISDNIDDILNADGVVFPGVGNANSAMADLRTKGLDIVLPKIKVPFLGICLGLQLLSEFSEEGNTECLKVIEGKTLKFNDEFKGFREMNELDGLNRMKVPQIGWNKVMQFKADPVFAGIPDESYFYFVNSYYLPVQKETIGKSDYGIEFSAVVRKKNFWATQFHPEKSGETGKKLLRNFCELCL